MDRARNKARPCLQIVKLVWFKDKNSSLLLRACIGFWIILDRENIEYNGN